MRSTKGTEERRFHSFITKLVVWAERDGSPLATFLGKFYLPTSRCESGRWSGLRCSERPYPCFPPFAPEGISEAGGRRSRKRSRYCLLRDRMIFTNAICGLLSWMALGRPKWMTPAMFGRESGPAPQDD